MKKNIPAVELLVCDRCGAEGRRIGDGPFGNGASLHIDSWYRIAQMQLPKEVDICQKCCLDFNDWVTLSK